MTEEREGEERKQVLGENLLKNERAFELKKKKLKLVVKIMVLFRRQVIGNMIQSYYVLI